MLAVVAIVEMLDVMGSPYVYRCIHCASSITFVLPFSLTLAGRS